MAWNGNRLIPPVLLHNDVKRNASSLNAHSFFCPDPYVGLKNQCYMGTSASRDDSLAQERSNSATWGEEKRERELKFAPGSQCLFPGLLKVGRDN